MKFSRGLSARIAVAAAGSLVLAGAAGAAFADEVGSDEVDVNVEIAPVVGPGSLSMSVDGTSTTLTEGVSGDEMVRQFEGGLPTVTVTDSRDVADIPEGVGWSVLGQASDFTGTAGTLPAGHLGWEPALVDDEGDGQVFEGPIVDTVMDEDPNDVGLASEELLYITLDSRALVESGQTSWSATANLFLKTPRDVAPGSYTSTLTLSLFEDVL